MTSSTSNTIDSLIVRPKSVRPKSGISPWAGLLIALLCALLLPGCGKTNSKLDAELAALDSSDAIGRENALLHLSDMGVDVAQEAADKAVALLKDTDAGVRAAALNLITLCNHNTPEAIATLSAMATGDADFGIQVTAMDALLAFGANEQHVKAARAHLASDNAESRCAGANCIADASAESIAALEKELAAALTDKDDCVREYSALALEKLGDKASAETKAALAAVKKN